MKQKSSMKSWIIVGIVIFVAIVVYYGFFSGSNIQPDTGSLEIQPEGELVGAQVLNLLNQIQSLKIDKTFFESAAYQSLTDYTVAIPDQGVGRTNPFAPIPGFNPKPAETSSGRR